MDHLLADSYESKKKVEPSPGWEGSPCKDKADQVVAPLHSLAPVKQVVLSQMILK